MSSPCVLVPQFIMRYMCGRMSHGRMFVTQSQMSQLKQSYFVSAADAKNALDSSVALDSVEDEYDAIYLPGADPLP